MLNTLDQCQNNDVRGCIRSLETGRIVCCLEIDMRAILEQHRDIAVRSFLTPCVLRHPHTGTVWHLACRCMGFSGHHERAARQSGREHEKHEQMDQKFSHVPWYHSCIKNLTP